MGEHLPSATVSWPPLMVNVLFHPHVTPVAMDYKQEFASTYLTGRGSFTVKNSNRDVMECEPSKPSKPPKA